jgi:hypothetical protein
LRPNAYDDIHRILGLTDLGVTTGCFFRDLAAAAPFYLPHGIQFSVSGEAFLT